MINLIVKDGLGNQMFQYAFARYLQEEYQKQGINEQICINPYFIENTVFIDNDERRMSLQHLSLNESIRILPVNKQVKSMKIFKIRTAIASGIVKLFEWRVLGIKDNSREFYVKRSKYGIYYGYSAYTFFPTVLSSKKEKFVFGFFQTEKYFKDISYTIKTELKVRDKPSVENQKMLNKILKSNSVCLHIRRGDYLNAKWKNLQICDYSYYNRAVNYILDHVENPLFFVFSNTKSDLNWIRENYHFKDNKNYRGIKLVFVDLNNPDYEELRLMYSCRHFVISNSTFSWWGAYLSDNPAKIVCVPNRWNLSANDEENIYVDGWIRI